MRYRLTDIAKERRKADFRNVTAMEFVNGKDRKEQMVFGCGDIRESTGELFPGEIRLSEELAETEPEWWYTFRKP